MSKPERKTTFAIRFTGACEKADDPMYVCLPEEADAKLGYMYCCPCKETLQFASEPAAEAFMSKFRLSTRTHTIKDSVTAGREREERKSRTLESVTSAKSAITVILKKRKR